MTIAREEIFGPALSLMPCRDEADAIRIADDTPCGLAAYVRSGDRGRARCAAGAMRAGAFYPDGASEDFMPPFGGHKQSGNGREYADRDLDVFLETRAVIGWGA